MLFNLKKAQYQIRFKAKSIKSIQSNSDFMLFVWKWSLFIYHKHKILMRFKKFYAFCHLKISISFIKAEINIINSLFTIKKENRSPFYLIIPYTLKYEKLY